MTPDSASFGSTFQTSFRRSLEAVEIDGEATRAPSLWAASLLSSLVLAVLGMVGVILAVYEYNNWQTARTASGVLNDYSPGTYLAVMLVSGVVGLLALVGSYMIGSRWRRRRRCTAPERERP